jgi:hypothetical protein
MLRELLPIREARIGVDHSHTQATRALLTRWGTVRRATAGQPAPRTGSARP